MSLKSESNTTVTYDGSLVQWMENIVGNWSHHNTGRISKRIRDSGKEEINQVVCFPETSKLLTPLTVAINLWAHVSVIDALLDKGANVNFRDEKNRTPLHLACGVCVDIDVLTLLIEKGGADYTVIDDKGRNCLMLAAATQYSVNCAYLLNNCQMNPNQQDREGNTALHYCIRGSKIIYSRRYKLFETMEVLLKYGSDPSLKNNMGQDAVDFAAIHGKYKELKHLFPKALETKNMKTVKGITYQLDA